MRLPTSCLYCSGGFWHPKGWMTIQALFFLITSLAAAAPQKGDLPPAQQEVEKTQTELFKRIREGTPLSAQDSKSFGTKLQSSWDKRASQTQQEIGSKQKKNLRRMFSLNEGSDQSAPTVTAPSRSEKPAAKKKEEPVVLDASDIPPRVEFKNKKRGR